MRTVVYQSKMFVLLLACVVTSAQLALAQDISSFVSEMEMPELYRSPSDIEGISQMLHEHGLVIIKGLYSMDAVTAMKEQWSGFMDKFNNLINSDSDQVVRARSEYGTHFIEGLKVDRLLSYSTENFFAYKFGEGRYEIRFNELEGNFVSESVLTPKALREFLEHHFFLSDQKEPSHSYSSFYGLLPSLPGNSDGNLHRDTTFMEPEDIDGSVSSQFCRAFYLTAITAIGDDPGSTEFYLGTHKMNANQVKEKLAKGEIDVIKPKMKEGDVKLFDGRIGHRGVANVGSEERKGIYAVHHSSWYRDL